MGETWKQINNSPGYYISDCGNVKADGKKVKIETTQEGYFRCSVGGTLKRQYVHRLVAMHFIENDNPQKTLVDHIDGNKKNNRVENLRWVTPQENTQYCADMGLFGKGIRSPVIAVNVKSLEVRLYESQAELCREKHLDDGAVNKVIKGKRYTTHDWFIKPISYEGVKIVSDDAVRIEERRNHA